ncbi:MAG: Fic family protein [Bacteroidota bacterium]
MAGEKYRIPKDEGEILQNKFGFTELKEIEQSEFEGFLYAYKILFNELNEETKFNLKYILRMHELALGHLYSFAGKFRNVNISKGGFIFPPAKFLNETMNEFEKNILLHLKSESNSEEQLIKDIARVHAELLFIHPFREGNGRTARLLANLMAAKAGHKLLDLENFRKEKFNEYVNAIQHAAKADYSLMEKIIRSLF